MIIEIRTPELEALIQERMKSGAFRSPEEVIIHALKGTLPSRENVTERQGDQPTRTGTELIAAMQASPFKEIELEPGRERMPVRDVSF
jgi:Arc/MetJ-type ribon-helix-helix transcriptional regulator